MSNPNTVEVEVGFVFLLSWVFTKPFPIGKILYKELRSQQKIFWPRKKLMVIWVLKEVSEPKVMIPIINESNAKNLNANICQFFP